jgi:hypothetical protein
MKACAEPAFRNNSRQKGGAPLLANAGLTEYEFIPDLRLGSRLGNAQWPLPARPPVAPRPCDGPLTEPIAGAQPRPQERVLMPHCGHPPLPGRL